MPEDIIHEENHLSLSSLLKRVKPVIGRKVKKKCGVRMSNIHACVAPTEFAITKGAFVNNDGQHKTEEGYPAVMWWLRSPGFSEGDGLGVGLQGELAVIYAMSNYVCVRPAIWLDVEKYFSYSALKYLNLQK